jgi:hypothetical protein
MGDQVTMHFDTPRFGTRNVIVLRKLAVGDGTRGAFSSRHFIFCRGCDQGRSVVGAARDVNDGIDIFCAVCVKLMSSPVWAPKE